MARSTSAAIRAVVRQLVGDTDTTTPLFSDDQVEDALDLLRDDYSRQQLEGTPDTDADGAVTYTRYLGPPGSESVTLTDEAGTLVTPTAADDITGRYTLAASTYPLYWTGSIHDPYGAAANLLEAKLALGADGYVQLSAGKNALDKGRAWDNVRELIGKYRDRAITSAGRGAEGGVVNLQRGDYV